MKYTITRQRNNKPETIQYLLNIEHEHDDSVFIDFTDNFDYVLCLSLFSTLRVIHEIPLIAMDDHNYSVYLVVEKEFFLVAKLERKDDSKRLIFLDNHVMSMATKWLHLENLKVIHDMNQKQTQFLGNLTNFLISQV